MIPIVSPFLIRLLSGNFARAMAIYPFVIFKHKELKQDLVILNHERIHLRQQLELFIVPFYLIYFIEYFIGRAKGMNHEDAYRNIRFEKEAYENESNLSYLKKRNLYCYWRK